MSNRPNRRPAVTTSRSAPPADRTKVLLVVGAIGLLVVLIGIVIAMADGADDPDTTTGTPAGATYGPVVVEDAGLPDFTSTQGDEAIGQAAPRLEGTAPDGSPVTISGSGEPTLVAFVAHWCPHCQVEVPVLVDLMEGGDLDGVRVVAVVTGTDEQRPNFPPVAWLERERWTGEILLDDESGTAARSYGLSSYPFLVFLDGEGTVVARTQGEIAADDIVALADAAR